VRVPSAAVGTVDDHAAVESSDERSRATAAASGDGGRQGASGPL